MPSTNATECQCVPCGECAGGGNVWFSFGHREYLGSRRCDDLDEMETCDECRGTGISEMCDRCVYIMEMEEECYDL